MSTVKELAAHPTALISSQVINALLIAVVIWLAGELWDNNTRVTTLEAKESAMVKQVDKIEEGVEWIKRFLLESGTP